ncbi:DNA cytosine methyltransferase [Sulfitobacter sp. S190]|uniref:DNA cytosine methyltransferase n=1 Tax=Sulfitobacter sp. S190 TaxID=2867022 RepID=UPI0021A87907|nr:DNA cytosine methyltransferase [Sulfitobacter sp. S190]UWR21620.1 DNA cytosine methyltransferase [Sulfitobacter sp. S190]
MGVTVSSFFSGIGGLDLGFDWAGATVHYATDLSPIAAKTYPLNFGRELVEADINNLCHSQIPNSDIIIGGPPCQSFSLVGLRRPDDERGKLVFRFIEIIRSKNPSGFVLENVPGLSSARIDGERLTSHLARELEALGYFVTVMKLNAAQYLVPQLRKRVFIVGSRVSPVAVPNPEEFAKSVSGRSYAEYEIGSWAALRDLGEVVGKGELTTYSQPATSQFAALMRRRNADFSLHEMPRMSETDKTLIKFIPPGGNYMDVPDEFSTQRIMNFKRTGGRTTTYGRLHPLRPAYTINTYFRRPNVGANFHPVEDRLISVREAMRLQSIPDKFSIAKIGPQDERNALVGNAVPPLLAHAVARELLRSLGVTVQTVKMTRSKSTISIGADEFT